MKNNLRRALALLLVLTLLVGIAPAVFADEVEPTGTEVIVGSTDPPNESTAPPEETEPVETTTPPGTEPRKRQRPRIPAKKQNRPRPLRRPRNLRSRRRTQTLPSRGDRFLGTGRRRCPDIVCKSSKRCGPTDLAGWYSDYRIQQGQLVCWEYGVLVVSRGLRQNVG